MTKLKLILLLSFFSALQASIASAQSYTVYHTQDWSFDINNPGNQINIPAPDPASGFLWLKEAGGIVNYRQAKHNSRAKDGTYLGDTHSTGVWGPQQAVFIWSRDGLGSMDENVILGGTWSLMVDSFGLGPHEAHCFIDSHVGYSSTLSPTFVKYSVSQGKSLTLTASAFEPILELALKAMGLSSAAAAEIANLATYSTGAGVTPGGASLVEHNALPGDYYEIKPESEVIFLSNANGVPLSSLAYAEAKTESDLYATAVITLQ